MKNHKRYFTSIAALAILATACEDGEGMTEADVEVPEGYELSAGTATNFLTSSFAYDTDADWLSGEYQKRFTRGDRLYDDALTSSNGYGGGLGPVYAGYSCGSCHHNAGRTKPAVWTQNSKGEYGSGDYGFSAMLVYVTRRNGAFFQDYGRVLHDQAIYGVKPEGKLKVEWQYMKGQFPDGEEYELCLPKYTITEWYED